MRLIALISGGIDSPVAAYTMASAGAEIILLHMDNRPYADDEIIDHVERLAIKLREVTGQEMPLYCAPHFISQDIIKYNCDNNYQCVMCKRMMQRTARELAKKLDCKGIVMGDSLGQVASQTLKNIRSENVGLNFPVVRPLIGYDKLEIEAIAKEIGTYNISIEQICGCRLVPLKPITEADPDKIHIFDDRTDTDGLAEKIAADAKIIHSRLL